MPVESLVEGPFAYLWRLRLTALTAVLLLTVGLAQPLLAQCDSPYDLDWGRELTLYGVGAITLGGGQYASARLDLLRIEDVEALSRDDILRIDRFSSYRNSARAQQISDVIGYGATAVPLTLLASDRIREQGVQVGVLYTETLLLNGGITYLVKNTVHRPRPYVYNDAFTMEQRRDIDGRRSFFSGHTSNTAANAFFTAQVYSDFYPEAGARTWVWTTAALLPAATGVTRVLSGNHYLTDVLVGYAVGAGIGILVPRLHRVASPN